MSEKIRRIVDRAGQAGMQHFTFVYPAVTLARGGKAAIR